MGDILNEPGTCPEDMTTPVIVPSIAGNDDDTVLEGDGDE